MIYPWHFLEQFFTKTLQTIFDIFLLYWNWLLCKLDRTRKLWFPFLRNFLPVVLKFYFWKGGCALSSASSHYQEFSSISKCPKMISLVVWQLKGHLVYIVFMLDIKYQFLYWWIKPAPKSCSFKKLRRRLLSNI